MTRARGLAALMLCGAPTVAAVTAGAADPPRSSAWLSLLPDGEAKRKFILDCTGCHQFDEKIARPQGSPRTEAQWVEAVTRMLGYAGATTSFPVIAADRDAKATAAWLAKSLRAGEVADIPVPASRRADVREYMMPVAQDLPHDLVVEPDGDVLITGMFTHRLYRLKPETGAMTEIAIPVVPSANPRAIDRDAEGRTWLVLGQPKRLAMVTADTGWRSWDVGMYPHSLAVAPDGKVWFNGHFTREPELIGFVDPARDTVATFQIPAHPTMAKGPGGPIPYEIRAAPDGRIWLGELQGNRLVVLRAQDRKIPDLHHADAAQRAAPLRRRCEGCALDPGLFGEPAGAAGSRHGRVQGDSPAGEGRGAVRDPGGPARRRDLDRHLRRRCAAPLRATLREVRDLSAAESRRPGATPGRGSQERSGVAGVRGVARDTGEGGEGGGRQVTG